MRKSYVVMSAALMLVACGGSAFAADTAPQTDTSTTSTGYAPGTKFVALPNNARVLAVAPDGTQSSVGSGWSSPIGVAADLDGTIYVADRGLNKIVKLPVGGAPTTIGTVSNPYGLAIDSAGNVIVGDPGNGTVEQIAPDGSEKVLASNLGGAPKGVAVNAAGDVYVAVDSGTVQKIPAGGGTPVVVRGGLCNPQGVALDAAGDLFIANTTCYQVDELTASGQFLQTPGEYGAGPGFYNFPYQVAVDPTGNLVISDTNNRAVYQVDAPVASATTASRLFSTPGVPFQVAFQPTGTGSDLQALVNRFSSNAPWASGLNSKISKITDAPNANAKAGALNAFSNQVAAKTGKGFTSDQAAVLNRLAGAL